MSQTPDTVEDSLKVTSSIEELENVDLNEDIICPFPVGLLENATDEENNLCSLEFSNLSINYSEDKDISNVESKLINLCDRFSEIDQQEPGMELFNKDNCAEEDLKNIENTEHFEICGPAVSNIEALELNNIIGEKELNSSSDEKKQDCINIERLTQTVEEIAGNVIELNNPRKNQNPEPILENPLYFDIVHLKDDFNQMSHLNVPVCEESLVQPSRKTEVETNEPQVSEDTSNKTIKAIEFYSKLLADSIMSMVLEKCLNKSTRSLESQSKIPGMVDPSSTVSEISNSRSSISKTVIEQSTVSEDTSKNNISRNVGGKLRKDRLVATLKFLDNIIGIVDKLELMNNRLMETVESIFKKQQILQELINMVNEQLVNIRLLPSQVIFVENKYTVGLMSLNVQIVGEDIFENLKTMKKELNGSFRECSALRKDFGYVTRKICSIPFELTEDFALENTMERAIRLYSNVCRVYKKRKRLETIGRKITAETFKMVLRAYDFGDYIEILYESLSREILV